MSVSRGCILLELTRDKWYCIVAIEEYDYDFVHGCIKYGPTATPEAAFDLMSQEQPNPGSYQTIRHDKVGSNYILIFNKAR